MQHSSSQKIILLRTFKIILFVAIIVFINTIICHYLGPSAHKSDEMWSYYYRQENADTIIVGTSVTDMVSEFVLDEYTGRRCINMGTPSQYFATSRDIITTATKDRPVDTIILMMGFDALERDEDMSATLAVEKGFYDSKSISGKLKGFLKENIHHSLETRNIRHSVSINKWFSWPVSCIAYFDQIKPNLEKKEYYSDVVNDSEMKALSSNSVSLNRKPMPAPRKLNTEILKASRNIQTIKISEDSLKILKQMCDYCTINDIRFIVMVSPHMSGYAGNYGEDYDKLNALMAGIVEGAGCTYLNLNDLPSVTDLMTDQYFTDSEHVTHEGIEVASGIISDILNLLTGKRN